MKGNVKRRIPGVLIMLFALTALVGSRTFLGPCVHDDGSFGSCHWAGQALLGVSALIFAESLCVMIGRSPMFRRGLYVSVILTGVLGILTPGILIGLCRMAAMRCRSIMRPGMTILFSMICVSAMAGLFLSRPDEDEPAR